MDKWGIGKGIEFDDKNPYADNEVENELYEANSNTDKADEIRDGRTELFNIQKKIEENGYVNLSNNEKFVSADNENHIKDLLKIICGIYPYGIEADTREEYAYKLLHFKRWFGAGIEGKTENLEKLGMNYNDYSKPVQLTLFDNTSWGIIEFVREFRNICDSEMQKNSFVDLRMVFQHMQEPPYGMYQCNYYGLCIGISLQKYKSGYYQSGNLVTQRQKT